MSTRISEVDAYLENLPADRREALSALRELVHRTVPDVSESMKYNMPTFSTTDIICSLAAQKHHLGLYICSDVLDPYLDRLEDLDMGKGCLRFRQLDDLPMPTVVEILAAAAENPGFRHC